MPSSSSEAAIAALPRSRKTNHTGTIIALIASLVLHVSAVAAMRRIKTPAIEKKKPAVMDIAVVEEEPAPPPPEPVVEEPEKSPEPSAPVSKDLGAPKVEPKAEPKENTPPPAAQETVEDFTGTTLTNEGGESWASATGNGTSSNKPIGAPGVKTGRTNQGVVGGSPDAAPRTVGLGDLSERPKAPDLDNKLEQYYPADARRQEVEGEATVSARINADGTVSQIRVVSESFAGFGAACKKTLTGSLWSAPRDKKGAPVATVIKYSCRFEMRY